MIVITLPAISFLLLWVNLNIRRIQVSSPADWRTTFLHTSLLIGGFITATTEILSIFSLFEQKSLVIIWGIFVLCLTCWFIKSLSFIKYIKLPTFKLNGYLLTLVISMVIIGIILGIIAWIAPPNNWDSMTYHMSRVVHWIHNKNVGAYPTANDRQIWQNPFAEYVIAQLQIITGNDQSANYVQWFSMIAACIGTSLIARQLGADTKSQIIASTITMTLPMGILQATTTQNDYVFAWWMVCFVYCTFRLISMPTLANSFWVGLSLGLALLTKAITYPYAVPYLIMLVIIILIRHKHLSIKLIAPIVGMVLVVNAAFITRNYITYGSLIGNGNFSTYANGIFSFSSVASNIVRNLGLHTPTPSTTVDQVATQIMDFVHRNMLHISMDDPRTTASKYLLAKDPLSEDYAGNPIHLFLIIISLFIFILHPRLWHSRKLLAYAGTLIIAFIIFCAYLKWQPWNSRLHLALFVLWSPFVAVIINKVQFSRFEKFFPTILVVLALPWLFLNIGKPLLPSSKSIISMERSPIMFIKRPYLYKSYQSAVDYLKSNHSYQTGLLFGNDDWEYPLWALTNKGSVNMPYSFEQVIIKDYNFSLITNSPPKYIVTTDIKQYPKLTLAGREYDIVWSSKYLWILTTK